MPFYYSSFGFCHNCERNCGRCISTGKCAPVGCPDGQALKPDNSCVDCNKKCKKCQHNALDTCTEGCVNSERLLASNCECPVGKYSSNPATSLNCDATCSHKCNGCSDTTGNCKACSHSTRLISSNCDCKPGYYNRNSEPACIGT